MKIKSLELETVCGVTSKFPENILPEFSFAGKSNVGKSSLINTLVNRKSFARTSSTPGKTQTVNFYNINKALYFVDLPGYGYARVAKTEREKWGKMIEKYLHGSKVLRQVFLLVDIRHDPGENDRLMYDWIVKNGYEPIVIATKMDKIKRSQLDGRLTAIRKTLGMKTGGRLIPFSAETKSGKDEIWNIIEGSMPGSEAEDTDERK